MKIGRQVDLEYENTVNELSFFSKSLSLSEEGCIFAWNPIVNPHRGKEDVVMLMRSNYLV